MRYLEENVASAPGRHSRSEALGAEMYNACSIRKNIRATEAIVPRWREFTSRPRGCETQIMFSCLFF